MATISTLAVNLVARTSAFEKGMKRSSRSMKTFKTTAQRAAATLKKFATGILAVAGIGGMGFLLKNTLATLDAVSKLSRRLDITHEALLGLRHAGELAGVTIQAMDKALETFSRRMGEVKAGSGEAKRGLEALGLSAEKMIAMTPDKALLVIADRIETLGTQAEKAAAAYFLFGRAGAQMLNLFEQGAEGIAKAQAEAKKLGITLEGYDLTKIEAANDAMLAIKRTALSLFGVIVIKLSPAIKKLAKGMGVLIRFLQSNTVKYLAMATAIVWTVAKIKALIVVVKAIANSYRIFAIAQSVVLSLQGPKGWITLAVGIGVATAAIISLNAAMKDTQAQADAVVASVKKIAPSIIESSIRQEITQRENILADLRGKLAAKEKAIADRGLLNNQKESGMLSQFDSGKLAELIAFEEKSLGLAKAHLVTAIQARRVAQDVANADSQRLVDQKKMLALSNEAVRLRASLLTPTEALLEQEKRIELLHDERLINTEEYFKALAKIDDEFQAIADADKEDPLGELKGGRFQEIRSEFIDVAALNAGGSTKGVNKTNELLQKSMFIQQQTLTEIKGTATL